MTLDPRARPASGRTSPWSNGPSSLAFSDTAGGGAPLDLLTPLDLINPGPAIGQAIPFKQGICLPRGLLRNAGELRLLDPLKRPVPLGTETLARWSDGSPQWVLCDWLAEGVPTGRTTYWLARTNEEEAPSLTDSEIAILERTATSGFHGRAGEVSCEVVDGRLFLCFVMADGRECQAQVEFPLVARTGRRYEPSLDDLLWETHGPLRSVVRVSGKFRRCRGLRFSVRVSLYRSANLVKLEVNLHNERRARHRGGLWDLGDPGSFLFRSFGVEINLPTGWRRRAALRVEPGALSTTAGRERVGVYQDSSGGENWQNRNHVNRHGQTPCRIQGYQGNRGDEQFQGLRASPVLSLSDGEHWLAAGIPEFWQQFPKSLHAAGDQVSLGLFPAEWGDEFELQGGESKTHVVWLRAGAGDEATADALDWIHQPPRAMLPPGWYAACGVFSELLPPVAPHTAKSAEGESGPGESTAQHRFEQLMTEAIGGDRSLLARREIIDEFGWRNYGEVWADHEEAFCPGPRPVITHYNNQFDLILGGILQMARTGDPTWCELFDPLARHVAEIDLYQTPYDRAAYSGGLFWFTDHYLHAETSSHRTYSRANQPSGQPYGGGPGPEHNFTSGLLHYYYLTGNPTAAAAVRLLANWVLAMDDGLRTPWGIIDASPTGMASGYKTKNIPNRGAANSLRALVDAWLLTGERHYLLHGEQIIARVVHPTDDIEALDLLDAEKNWSYTMFLSELARYLDVKSEARQRDAAYDLGVSSLVHYARWMAAHERPYLEQPEKLEYPTEAWAAQEFRKANVVRLAARYVDDPERTTWLNFAEKLADRAWEDLWRFESRDVARALAILMFEGTRDAYFRRTQELPPPRLDWHPVTAAQKSFVPQRQMARRQLSSITGWLRLAGRIANPAWWPWMVRRLRQYF